MKKLLASLLLLSILITGIGCASTLTLDSPDNSILITANDTTDTVYFAANMTAIGGGNVTDWFGNVTTPDGTIVANGNDSINLVSDGTIGIRAWDGNSSVELSVIGGGGGCSDVFETFIGTVGTNPVASGCADTLNLISTTGEIDITGNAAGDSLDFTLANTYLQNIVEDLSPQLGANLDGQTYTITAEGITSTIPDNANKIALTINQDDVTNNPIMADFTNEGINNGLRITQNGILGVGAYGLLVDTNAIQPNSGLVHFRQNNAGSSAHVLRLTNDGTGSGIYFDQNGNGIGLYFNNDGTNHGAYISQGGILANGDHALYVTTTDAQINSDLVNFMQGDAGCTEHTLVVRDDGTGGALFINQNGNGIAVEIDSEATSATGIDADFQNTSGDLINLAVGVNEKFAVDFDGNVTFADAYTFPNVDGALNEVLTTDGAGVVSWAAGGGGADDLNDVYERGSTVTVDVADVIWNSAASGMDFIIDLQNTGDFIIKDNSTTFATFSDTGTYSHVLNNTNAVYAFGLGGTITTLNAAIAFGVDLTHDRGVGVAGTVQILRGVQLEINENTDISSGGGYDIDYCAEITTLCDTAHSGTFSQWFDNTYAGVYGAASSTGARSMTGTADRHIYGLQYAATNSGAFSTGAAADNVAGIYLTVNDNIAYSSGTYTSITHGLNVDITAGNDGTHTVYGTEIDATGGDTLYGLDVTVGGATTNYGGYFNIPDNGQTGIAIKVGANQASADATLMDFRSTTGSEGTIALAAGGVVTYNAFTGSHYTQIQGDTKDLAVGTVLEIVDGDVHFPEQYKIIGTVEAMDEKSVPIELKGKNALDTVSSLVSTGASPEKEQLFLTRICSTEGSKSAVGVYGGSDSMGHDFCWSLGTGFILVANEGVNVAIGDYLMSSDVRGCAERQGSNYYKNTTLAKATEEIRWELGEKERLIKCILLGG